MEDKELQLRLMKSLDNLQYMVGRIGDRPLRQAVDQHLVAAYLLLRDGTANEVGVTPNQPTS